MLGYIYEIVCDQSDICYIGSTFNTLENRLNAHRSHFKRWDRGASQAEFAIYPYFRLYGPYEFKIELIKQYEVIDRAHLHAFETLWISKFNKTCVNKLIPFSPLKQRIKKETLKRYWRARKAEINEKNKHYNKLNRNRLMEQVPCDCGGHYQFRGRTYHFKSKKHARWATA